MKDLYPNLFFIVFGAIAAFKCEFLAQEAVKFQKKFFNYRVEEIGYKIGYLLVGLAFIIIGILSLFKII